MEQQAALTFLQQYLQQHLPLTVAMQVQAQQYDGQSLKLFAPLAVNHNDKGTAFAGSLSSLATVCGWCLAMLWAKEQFQQPCQVAVATAQIDYKKPTTSDFIAIATLPSAEQLVQVQQNLMRKKRARISMTIEIYDQQGMTVQQKADYAIWFV